MESFNLSRFAHVEMLSSMVIFMTQKGLYSPRPYPFLLFMISWRLFYISEDKIVERMI